MVVRALRVLLLGHRLHPTNFSAPAETSLATVSMQTTHAFGTGTVKGSQSGHGTIQCLVPQTTLLFGSGNCPHQHMGCITHPHYFLTTLLPFCVQKIALTLHDRCAIRGHSHQTGLNYIPRDIKGFKNLFDAFVICSHITTVKVTG